MERESIYYLDPETDLTDSDVLTYSKKSVPAKNYSEIIRALLQYLENCDREAILTDGVYHKYAFSIYDKIFGIPSYSWIYPESFKDIMHAFKNELGSASARKITSSPLTKFFGYPALFYKDHSQAYNIFMRLNGLANKRKVPADSEYKIHLCVKEQYAFYAFLKLALVVYPFFKSLLPDNAMEIKWNLQSRFDRITPADKVLWGSNGGPTASIVFYTSSEDPDVVRRYLQLIIRGFPEESSIGLLGIEGGPVPMGNVRVNHMLCYALGDRLDKIKLQKKNRTQRRAKPVPSWLKRLQKSCGVNSTKANKKSQRYLGINICNNPVDEFCTDNQCYLGDGLDPNSI